MSADTAGVADSPSRLNISDKLRSPSTDSSATRKALSQQKATPLTAVDTCSSKTHFLCLYVNLSTTLAPYIGLQIKCTDPGLTMSPSNVDMHIAYTRHNQQFCAVVNE